MMRIDSEHAKEAVAGFATLVVVCVVLGILVWMAGSDVLFLVLYGSVMMAVVVGVSCVIGMGMLPLFRKVATRTIWRRRIEADRVARVLSDS